MKSKLGLLAFSLLTSLSVSAGDSSQCGFISDNDYRALCRALAEHKADQCGFISNGDLRAFCRAVSMKDSSQCGFISDNNMRAMCRALSV
jgi:hypothetical protein